MKENLETKNYPKDALQSDLQKLAVVTGNVVFSTIWRGFVLKILWKWFVVDNFNLPALSIFNALGLACLVTLAFPHDYSAVLKDNELQATTWRYLYKLALFSFIYPLVCLIAGWIFVHFR